MELSKVLTLYNFTLGFPASAHTRSPISLPTSLILQSALTFLQIIMTQASNFKSLSSFPLKSLGEVLVWHSPERQKVPPDKEKHIGLSRSFLKDLYCLLKTTFLPNFEGTANFATRTDKKSLVTTEASLGNFTPAY